MDYYKQILGQSPKKADENFCFFRYAKELSAPYELLKETAAFGCLPVVNFAAGGIATPSDAAMMMQLGCDGIFVGSGIFKSGNPVKVSFFIHSFFFIEKIKL